uniref:phospholipase A2 n=1 Tax=Lygus hesperus TaxID=30085 RepID=A0A0A9XCQ4_LYGHE
MSLQRLIVVLVAVSSTAALKRYSGVRARGDTQLRVLFHEQTVAVVEYGKDRMLYTCELIEVKTPEERKTTLEDLLQVIPKKAYKLKFDQMMDLMMRCHQLSEPKSNKTKSTNAARAVPQPRTFSTLAIFPGTKWCGSGDVAESYFDLGTEVDVDKCCRAHDICPVKVLGRSELYGLKNDGLFTTSHCACDKEFFNCLKKTKNNIADSMGAVYFNLLGGTCMYSQNNKYLLGKKPRYNT